MISSLSRRFVHAASSKLCKATSISQVLQSSGEGNIVKIKGWVKSLRTMKDRIFVDVSDGSCVAKMQAVVPKTMRPKNLSVGASIVADGTTKRSPSGAVELDVRSLTVVGACNVADGYPFVPRQVYAPDYTRQYLHFRPRTTTFGALLRIRDAAVRAIDEHYRSRGFVSVHVPVLTSNDCEGAGEVFTARPDNDDLLKSMSKTGKRTDATYFDSKVFLTVSGQLHLEAATHGLSRVYALGPTFRAENSKSRLHLSEFYMLEAEEAFVDDLAALTGGVETLLKSVTGALLDAVAEDVALFRTDGDRRFGWLDRPFVVLAYDEAVAILERNRTPVPKGAPLTKEHEHFLVKHGGGAPTFVVDWPRDLKPFYMKQMPDTDKVAAFDLLVPNVGELVGGSLREDSYDRLKSKIPPGNDRLDWYLDLRKFGSVPSGGYGMGFERYLQLLLNVQNIKDTIPFPRWPHNCAM